MNCPDSGYDERCKASQEDSTYHPIQKCEVTLPLCLRSSNPVNTFNCPPVSFAYDRRACWQDACEQLRVLGPLWCVGRGAVVRASVALVTVARAAGFMTRAVFSAKSKCLAIAVSFTAHPSPY